MKAFVCVGLAVAGFCAIGEEWRQFRGNEGSANGAGDPPIEFGADKAVRWKVAVPTGHSPPCIVRDRVVLTGMEDGALVTFAISREDGKKLWSRKLETKAIEPAHRIGGPAAPTPCSDGERVFVYFGSLGLVAYDLEGKELWRREMPAPVVEFGTSSSPVLADGKLLLVVDQDVGSYLLALDARTGEVVWKTDRAEFRRGFSTPCVWRREGWVEVVVAGSLWVKGYDLRDGRELWSSRGMARVSNASPSVSGDYLVVSSWNLGGDEGDRVSMEPFQEFAQKQDANRDRILVKEEFPAGPIRDRFSQMDVDKDGRVTEEEYEGMRAMFAKAENQLFVLKGGGRGDITDSHLVWKVKKHLPYVSSPLIHDGAVYVVKNGGLASAFALGDGAPMYQGERMDAAGDYYSSPVAAGGRVYVASQKGVVVVHALKAPFNVLARNDLSEQIFATPAVIEGVLYVRTEKMLYAFAR
jgi:outer membrane protein assembly factor BamB